MPRGADLRQHVKQRCLDLLENLSSAARDQMLVEGMAQISRLYAPGSLQHTQILESPSFRSLYGPLRTSSNLEIGDPGALSLVVDLTTEESPSVLQQSVPASSLAFTSSAAAAPDWERKCHLVETELEVLKKRHFWSMLGKKHGSLVQKFLLNELLLLRQKLRRSWISSTLRRKRRHVLSRCLFGDLKVG